MGACALTFAIIMRILSALLVTLLVSCDRGSVSAPRIPVNIETIYQRVSQEHDFAHEVVDRGHGQGGSNSYSYKFVFTNDHDAKRFIFEFRSEFLGVLKKLSGYTSTDSSFSINKEEQMCSAFSEGYRRDGAAGFIDVGLSRDKEERFVVELLFWEALL